MRKSVAALVMSLLMFGALAATAQRSKRSGLIVDLRFSPQETIPADSVAFPQSLLDRSVDIRVHDSRIQADARILGEGTDDDDRSFPIRATADVVQFVADVIGHLADSQALKKASPADRQLNILVTRFAVNESNKAVGSTYAAEVHLAYTLKDAEGKTLTEGAATGLANRYGRARSAANCSEVLSDALKEAFIEVLADGNLQSAWMSGKPSSGPSQSPVGKESVEARLKKLDDLLEKGLITKEEHTAAREKILKDL